MIEKETDMTEQEIQKLIDRAIVAREKTYSPYSHFGVVQPFCVRMGQSMKVAI